MHYKQSNVKSFKIDIRFIYDYNDIEYDVGAAEFGKEDADEDKILHDNSKLIREAKDVLDYMLNTIMTDNNAQKLAGYSLQLKGLSGQFTSTHLTPTGLYVTVPLFKLHVPTSFANLEDFANSIANFFNMISCLESNARMLQSSLQFRKRRRSSLGEDFNSDQPVRGAHLFQRAIKPTF